MVSRDAPKMSSQSENPVYSTSRRRPSPEDSSPDFLSGSLAERVRRAGIITDVDDRHLTAAAQQIIDDLLFKLKQANDDKQWLTMSYPSAPRR